MSVVEGMIERAPGLRRTDVAHGQSSAGTRVLLACGVLYSLLYVAANDLVAATLYEGYRRADQAVSELSATAAPSRAFLGAMVPVFTGLLIAFGAGVWRSAAGSRPLRVTGVLLALHSATHPLWLLAPMTSREQMVSGASMPASDVGHLVLTAVTLAFILAQLGFAAAAFGRRFRRYCLLTAVAVVGFGGLTGVLSARLPAETPWMGLVERASVGAWLLWLAVLAVRLWRRTAR